MHGLKRGEGKKAEDEIKRSIRKIRKQRRRVTFGFYEKIPNGKSSGVFYSESYRAFDDDLQDKLRIYKEIKKTIIEHGCKISSVEMNSMEVTPHGVVMNERKKIEETVDISRPVKIRFSYEKQMI